MCLLKRVGKAALDPRGHISPWSLMSSFIKFLSLDRLSNSIQMERQPVRFVRGPFDGFSQDSQEAKRRG